MTRAEATTQLANVARILTEGGHGRTGLMGSSLVLNGSPVAFIGADNAIVVHGVEGVGRGAKAFPRVDETTLDLITALILSRFGSTVGRAA
jgi:hypothetical protein